MEVAIFENCLLYHLELIGAELGVNRFWIAALYNQSRI
jgi:hypothetical protein